MSTTPPDAPDFWDLLDQWVAEKRLVIDRPGGSCHPRYPDLVYPLDYGFLEGTTAADSKGIDVWRGSLEQPVLDAIVLTIDPIKNDAEIKLLLGCSEAEKQEVLRFFSRGPMGAQLVRRGGFYAWLSGRRSVRRFLDRPVPEQSLCRILEAAAWAPSAHNRQPWRFVVLKDPQAKAGLAHAMGEILECDLQADGIAAEKAAARAASSRKRIEGAPLALLVCLDSTSLDLFPDLRRQQAERLMGSQGVAMAAENLLLAAHAEGLGGVWLCAPLFAPQAARQALSLPETWQPQGLLLIGYPVKEPPSRSRRPVDEITKFV